MRINLHLRHRIGKVRDIIVRNIADKLSATALHLLGFDHTRLTVRNQGRDYRLTDVHGKLVNGILG